VSAGLVPADGSGAVELADVVAGRRPGRTSAAERIVVPAVGLAMDDVAAAWHVLAGARSRGLGTPLRLRSGPPVWE
jgi:ornithine cyclodeaminase